MFNKIIIAVLLVVLAGCSDNQQGASFSQPGKAEAQSMPLASEQSVISQAAGLNLIFFLNPNGRPCQMQVGILRDMSGELNGVANIKYVQTTVEADRELFSQYGIRALPTLLLADSTGNEIRRMQPGVKNAADIRALIQSVPRS